MITIFGEGRGFRVAWLLEEMGLPYRLRPIDLFAGSGQDEEFLAVNPAGFIPALRDGDIVLVESIAILEYLLARYGPTPLAPQASDAAFPLFQQFLHLGEAGLAMPINAVVATQMLAPEAEHDNVTTRWARKTFESRLGLVTRQLEGSPYVAGEAFTAADISVAYALLLARRTGNADYGDREEAYLTRLTGRDGYKRALDTCQATKAWATEKGE